MCMRKETLIRILEEREDLVKQIKMLQNKVDSIEDDIKAEMEERGVETLIAGPYNVSYKMITSSRFDSKGFREEHADLYESYKTETSYKRFSVK